MATATCLTQAVSISNYVRPVFTRDFVNGLRTLDDAYFKGIEQRKNAVKMFVHEFGTHYIEHTNMGAQLIYEKRFNERTHNSTEDKIRHVCTKIEAQAVVSTSSNTVFRYNTSTEINATLSECDKIRNKYHLEASESSDAVKIVTRGSRPKDLTAWVDADFKSVPIHRRLRRLNDLFRDEWLTHNDLYGIQTSLSGARINAVWDEILPDEYCSLMLSNVLDQSCKPFGNSALTFSNYI